MTDASPPLDYDRLAADYARHRRVHPGVLQALVGVPGLGPGAGLLEVGSGTGNYLTALATTLRISGIGLDPSRRMIEHARGRSQPIALVLGRAERLPFANATFDLIFSVDVIHHVKDRLAYFREAGRALSPGGQVCTVTDSADDIRCRHPLSNYFPETVPIELMRYPAVATLRAEMAQAGFRHIAEQRVEFAYELSDLGPYRDRSFSSLHLIPPAACDRGLARLEADLAAGPIPALSLYTLLWGMTQPPGPG